MNEGSLIIFGFVLSTHLLIIDTIICVSKVAELPQQGGRFALREGFDLFRKDVGLDGIDWATFSGSRCYALNLIDSAQGGNHHRAFLKSHLMIIGRRCAAPPASIPGDALETAVRFAGTQAAEAFDALPSKPGTLADARLSERASEYERFVAEHRLLLSPILEGLGHDTKRWDDAHIATLSEGVGEGDARVPPPFAMFNVMKADYLVARELMFQASREMERHTRRDPGLYMDTSMDTLDYAVYSVASSRP